MTAAGAELDPLVWQLGDWARRRSFGNPERDQLDSGWMVWRLRRYVRPDALPRRRAVVEFALRLAGEADERAWLVLSPANDVSACRVHPGYDIDVWVSADMAEMHKVVVGDGHAGRRAARRSRPDRRRPGARRRVPPWFAWRTPAPRPTAHGMRPRRRSPGSLPCPA